MIVSRQKTIASEWIDSNELRFTSSLHDSATYGGDRPVEIIHHIEVSGTVFTDTMTLRDMTPTAHVLPFGDCAFGASRVPELNGLRLDKDFRPRVLAVMGRTLGCTHFMSLCLELAQLRTLLAFSKARAALPDARRTDPEWVGQDRSLEGACYSLRADSPVIVAARPYWGPVAPDDTSDS